jgi:hypothetical protein
MKKSISPVVGILLILVALGIVFGVMWFQSEAPLVNRLPKTQPMNMPGPPPVPSAGVKRKAASPPGPPGKAPAPTAAPGAGEHR